MTDAPPRIALTRPVSDAMAGCELTHVQRAPIDVALARTQHRAYCAALCDAGLHVIDVPHAPALPDSVFVEDTSVVLDEVAVITRPGAASRRGEVDAVAELLASYRTVVRMREPATLDGGDVLRIGQTLFVGSSGRSNAAGMAQLLEAVKPFGYRVVPVPLTGCLHLKTAVTAVASDLLLINPQWVDRAVFGDMRSVEVSPDEPFAANALLVEERVIYPTDFPKTAAAMRAAGVRVQAVDVSELAKAEGGVTCCSIIFTA